MHEYGFTTCLVDLVGDFLPGIIQNINECKPCAFPGEKLGNAFADPLRRAGEPGNLPVKPLFTHDHTR